MTPRVRNILETRWEVVEKPLDGWVWLADTRSGHVESSSLKKQHRKALAIAKIRPFVLYSLRHTFLTRLGESGCDAWTRVTVELTFSQPSAEAGIFAHRSLWNWAISL